MISSNHKRLQLLNTICRICAKEDSNSISIFGIDGRKQNIIKKINTCLPVYIREDDPFPKKVCLTCLTKLDSFWAMHVLCKEAQTKIEKRFYSLIEQERNGQIVINRSVEEKLANLSASYPVTYGQSAVICLAQETSPPPPPPPISNTTITRDVQAVPQTATPGPSDTVITYLAPTPATPAQPAAPAEEIYPQALIQVPQNPVSEQPVVYQNPSVAPVVAVVGATATVPAPSAVPRRRAVVPKPMVEPAPPKRAAPPPLKRQNEETSGKKLCMYCNKYFTDDIIDHHTSLHLRQTFRTCLDCNKNFRSEEALERHRCESNENETINLDPDEDEYIMV